VQKKHFAGKRPQTVWVSGRVMHDNVQDDYDDVVDDDEDDNLADDDVENGD
jgi:hypothetical protein